MATYQEIRPEGDMLNILKGVGAGLGITIILMACGALLITYTQISENLMPVMVKIITLVSIFSGGFASCGKVRRFGLIKGSVAAIAYFMIVFLLSIILGQEVMFNPGSFVFILLGVLAGGIGGVCGINMRKNKK